jgi:hypothetical protein
LAIQGYQAGERKPYWHELGLFGWLEKKTADADLL